MSHALSFNDVTLTPVNHGNQLWIRAAELARALGYASEKSVSNLYARNADEFSNDMTVVIDLMTSDTPTKTRLFSPRGCHLIAMFARTPVAKAFRKWVLDVLDKLTVRVELPPAKAKRSVQKALPAPKLTIEEDIALFAEEVEQAHAQVYAHRERIGKRAIDIMARLTMCFTDNVGLVHFDAISMLTRGLMHHVTCECKNALSYPSEQLSDYQNPAKTLMNYAKSKKNW